MLTVKAERISWSPCPSNAALYSGYRRSIFPSTSLLCAIFRISITHSLATAIMFSISSAASSSFFYLGARGLIDPTRKNPYAVDWKVFICLSFYPTTHPTHAEFAMTRRSSLLLLLLSRVCVEQGRSKFAALPIATPSVESVAWDTIVRLSEIEDLVWRSDT